MDKKRELPRDTNFYSIEGGPPISNEEAFSEIANALMRLRIAFIKAGFKPPKEVHLADHKDGYKLRHILPPEMIYATVDLGDNDIDEVKFNICGIDLRYPARYRRTKNGIDTF